MIDRVLFLMEQYCDADPKCGPSGAEHQVVGAVRSTGLVKESKHFYFDQLSLKFGREAMGLLLLQDCALFQPDLIIYTPLGGALGERLNPSCMNTLMKNTKVFLNLWDAPEHGLENQWLPHATYLGIDSLVNAYRNYKGLPNVLFQHSTVDPTIHYDKGMERDIDVSFVGSIDPTDRRWPLRHEYTQFLKDNGIKIVTAGGQRGNRLPIEECANILNRSKISLDFCRSTDGKPTMHLRAFEVTSCGALLMTDACTLTGELFDEDFVIFQDKQDLLRLVRYYLEHDLDRAAIAKAGYERASYIYNARNMWGYIFEKMGFDIGDLATDKYYLQHKTVMETI